MHIDTVYSSSRPTIQLGMCQNAGSWKPPHCLTTQTSSLDTLVFVQTETDFTSSDKQTTPPADFTAGETKGGDSEVTKRSWTFTGIDWGSEGTMTGQAALNVLNGPRTVWTRAWKKNARTCSVVKATDQVGEQRNSLLPDIFHRFKDVSWEHYCLF